MHQTSQYSPKLVNIHQISQYAPKSQYAPNKSIFTKQVNIHQMSQYSPNE